MSGTTGKAILGGFVLSAVALGVAMIVLFGSGRFFSPTKKFVLYFPNSVNGLTVGSPVVFRGVPVGSVTDIQIHADLETLTMTIPVEIEIDPDRIRLFGGGTMSRVTKMDLPPGEVAKRLIAKGLRARLEMQSLVTGQLMIFLDFMPEVPIRLAGDTTMPEIPTAPSPFEELTMTIQRLPLQELADRLLAAIGGIERLVNSPDVASLAANLNNASVEANALITEVRTRMAPLAQRLDQTAKRFGELAGSIDEQVGPVTREMRQTLRVYSELAKDLDRSVEVLTVDLKKSLGSLDSTLGRAGGVVGENSPMVVELRRTLGELSRAARSIRVWAEYLERHPEAFIQGKGENRR